MSQKLNLKGEIFGRLTVLEEGSSLPNGLCRWICQCECGTIKEIATKYLRNKDARSCGCLKRKITEYDIRRRSVYNETKTSKFCSGCEQMQELEEFRFSKSNWDNKSKLCNECKWKYWIKRKYNLDYSLFLELLTQQNGKCAICEKEFEITSRSHPDVDHCHNTGIVRGLLCRKCNTGIGLLNHDTNNLKRAVKYLHVTSI
jgi:hypothetical protein